MGEVIKLRAERWKDVFETGDLVITVSNKGRVRIKVSDFESNVELIQELSMEEVAQLGAALSAAYAEDDGG